MTTFNETYDTATPAGSDDPVEADDRIREVKAAVQERDDVDHLWDKTGTEVSGADTGEHRKITLRTLTAVAVAALTSAKAYLYRLVTDGELYFKDASDNTLQLTDKGNNLPNATYLKATNEADDGSVDLIKAGKNEADDADVAVISDAARMASNAAPGEDTGIANKKYVDDSVTGLTSGNLTTFDSGWFAAVTSTTYTYPHSFETIPFMVQVWFSTANDDTGDVVLVGNGDYAASNSTWMCDVDAENIIVRTGGTAIAQYVDSGGTERVRTSGYLKIKAIK